MDWKGLQEDAGRFRSLVLVKLERVVSIERISHY